jgi:hypothetical protein
VPHLGDELVDIVRRSPNSEISVDDLKMEYERKNNGKKLRHGGYVLRRPSEQISKHSLFASRIT